MNSTGDLGGGSCSHWDDIAHFIVVAMATHWCWAPGLPTSMATLAVFICGCRSLGQALHLYLLNLALADVLFTLTWPLWLT
ncbi:hypothetical protein HJG60_000146 [Phyllostomus discolor]|uniref:Uncharacterized protein n=1 Tax=Phyllostomus discolor TaxID=89673 RepID=A0A834A213_9CHIR|nr:hypothetical protein HJG60_000146 [Phyllostomus discolor]